MPHWSLSVSHSMCPTARKTDPQPSTVPTLPTPGTSTSPTCPPSTQLLTAHGPLLPTSVPLTTPTLRTSTRLPRAKPELPRSSHWLPSLLLSPTPLRPLRPKLSRSSTEPTELPTAPPKSRPRTRVSPLSTTFVFTG